jgi:AcrR family transcriptional regulator
MVRFYSGAGNSLSPLAASPRVAGMSERPQLPIVGQEPRERSDAARNRQALLVAAQRLVDQCGVASVTMDAVAVAARVGKGTVFRRFGSRAGLMAALLDQFESDWQAQVIGGPPPLGPGAPPRERLSAFGRSRLEQNLRGAALIRAATDAVHRTSPAYTFLATALLAPMEVTVLERELELVDTALDPRAIERILAGWEDLTDRVVARRRDA